jgi:hypothetical protein
MASRKVSARGKAIASARKKTGTATDWKKVFKKLDKKKAG